MGDHAINLASLLTQAVEMCYDDLLLLSRSLVQAMLIKWSTNVEKSNLMIASRRSMRLISERESHIHGGLGTLSHMKWSLTALCEPLYDVQNAMLVLSQKRIELPTSIYRCDQQIAREVREGRGKSNVESDTLEDDGAIKEELNSLIKIRLVRSPPLPPNVTVVIENGLLILTVPNEFDVGLTLAGCTMDSRWRIVWFNSSVASSYNPGGEREGSFGGPMPKPHPQHLEYIKFLCQDRINAGVSDPITDMYKVDDVIRGVWNSYNLSGLGGSTTGESPVSLGPLLLRRDTPLDVTLQYWITTPQRGGGDGTNGDGKVKAESKVEGASPVSYSLRIFLDSVSKDISFEMTPQTLSPKQLRTTMHAILNSSSICLEDVLHYSLQSHASLKLSNLKRSIVAAPPLFIATKTDDAVTITDTGGVQVLSIYIFKECRLLITVNIRTGKFVVTSSTKEGHLRPTVLATVAHEMNYEFTKIAASLEAVRREVMAEAIIETLQEKGLSPSRFAAISKSTDSPFSVYLPLVTIQDVDDCVYYDYLVVDVGTSLKGGGSTVPAIRYITKSRDGSENSVPVNYPKHLLDPEAHDGGGGGNLTGVDTRPLSLKRKRSDEVTVVHSKLQSADLSWLQCVSNTVRWCCNNFAMSSLRSKLVLQLKQLIEGSSRGDQPSIHAVESPDQRVSSAVVEPELECMVNLTNSSKTLYTEIRILSKTSYAAIIHTHAYKDLASRGLPSLAIDDGVDYSNKLPRVIASSSLAERARCNASEGIVLTYTVSDTQTVIPSLSTLIKDLKILRYFSIIRGGDISVPPGVKVTTCAVSHLHLTLSDASDDAYIKSLYIGVVGSSKSYRGLLLNPQFRICHEPNIHPLSNFIVNNMNLALASGKEYALNELIYSISSSAAGLNAIYKTLTALVWGSPEANARAVVVPVSTRILHILFGGKFGLIVEFTTDRNVTILSDAAFNNNKLPRDGKVQKAALLGWIEESAGVTHKGELLHVAGNQLERVLVTIVTSINKLL